MSIDALSAGLLRPVGSIMMTPLPMWWHWLPVARGMPSSPFDQHEELHCWELAGEQNEWELNDWRELTMSLLVYFLSALMKRKIYNVPIKILINMSWRQPFATTKGSSCEHYLNMLLSFSAPITYCQPILSQKIKAIRNYNPWEAWAYQIMREFESSTLHMR